MANVTLVATRDFSYQTRRLKAGDTFTVPEKLGKVLVGIKKAAPVREPGNVAPPPPEVIQRAAAVTPQKRRRRKAK